MLSTRPILRSATRTLAAASRSSLRIVCIDFKIRLPIVNGVEFIDFSSLNFIRYYH